MQGAHEVDGHGACGGLAFFGADVAAKLCGPGLAVLAGDVAAQ
jgi:hypothetical protein